MRFICRNSGFMLFDTHEHVSLFGFPPGGDTCRRTGWCWGRVQEWLPRPRPPPPPPRGRGAPSSSGTPGAFLGRMPASAAAPSPQATAVRHISLQRRLLRTGDTVSCRAGSAIAPRLRSVLIHCNRLE